MADGNRLQDDLLASPIAPFVRDRWNGAQLVERLPAHQNLVFAGRIEDSEVVYRCAPGEHRTRAQIEDELTWISHLRNHGVLVPLVIASHRGGQIETTSLDGMEFHVSAFERIPGVPLSAPGALNESTANQWGRLIGQMNRIDLGFTHRYPFRWAGDKSGIMALGSYLSQRRDLPPQVAESFRLIESRTRTDATYGLIHSDCHTDNVRLCEDRLYALDFDECCLHWRMFDIANPIFSLYFELTRQKADPNRLRNVCAAMLRGFEAEFPQSSAELPLLHHFLVCRMGLLFAWVSGSKPSPRWMTSATEEWKAFLRDWSLAELRSGRIAELIC